MFLKFLILDVEHGAIEAQWYKPVTDDETGQVLGYRSARSVSYAKEQFEQMRADVGEGADVALFAQAAGWFDTVDEEVGDEPLA